MFTLCYFIFRVLSKYWADQNPVTFQLNAVSSTSDLEIHSHLFYHPMQKFKENKETIISSQILSIIHSLSWLIQEIWNMLPIGFVKVGRVDIAWLTNRILSFPGENHTIIHLTVFPTLMLLQCSISNISLTQSRFEPMTILA